MKRRSIHRLAPDSCCNQAWVEKLFPAKFAKTKSRQDALQTTFSVFLDIFYPPNFGYLKKMEFFNTHRRFRSLTLIVSVSAQQFCENGGRLPSSAVAGRSRLGRGRWSQLFPRVCRSPRICRGHSSTRGRLGRTSSWRRPLPGPDAEECR